MDKISISSDIVRSNERKLVWGYEIGSSFMNIYEKIEQKILDGISEWA